MDHLKEGIGLRGYSQKNPLNEYKREGFEMFISMTERVKADVVEYLFKAQIAGTAESTPSPQQPRHQRMLAHRGTLPTSHRNGEDTPVQTVRRQEKSRQKCLLSMQQWEEIQTLLWDII
jgi:preprotein translocase subunit SecA